MKKIIVLLASIFIMSLGTVCSASDGTDLDKEIGISEKIITGLTAGTVEFSNVSGDFSEDLKKNLDEKKYAELQKNIKNNFGSMKEHKFVGFTRFDKADRVQYISVFEKDNSIVSIIAVFDKNLKLIEVMFAPMQNKDQKPADGQQSADADKNKAAEQKPAN